MSAAGYLIGGAGAQAAQRRARGVGIRIAGLGAQQELGRNQHVDEGDAALGFMREIVLLLDGLAHRLGQAPTVENGLRDRSLPTAHDLLEVDVRRIGEVLGSHDDIESADDVQEAGEQGLIGIDSREPLGEHEASCRHVQTILPDLFELGTNGGRIGVVSAQLPHRKGDGDAANHVEPHSAHGFAQVRDLAVHATKFGGVRDSQQASGKRGLGAEYSNDVFGAGVRRLQRSLNAQDGFRERGKLEALVLEVLCELFYEAEADRLSGC